MVESKTTNVIQSLQVGFELIELIASSPKPLKFNEIHELSKMTKSNLHKYLHTLTMLGLLYRDKYSGHYSLGRKLIEYGMKAVNQENVVERINPYLHEINQTCKNTVLFTSWTSKGPVVVRMINSLEGLNVGAQPGTVLPLQSAAGKIYSAFLEDYALESWMSREIKKLKHWDPARFEREIEKVRNEGIAFASEPIVPSISSVAIPVFNYEPNLLGVIVVAGFSHTIATTLDDEMSQYLLQMRDEISKVFGYKNDHNFDH